MIKVINFLSINFNMFWVLKRSVSLRTYVLGAQKIHRIKLVLLSTHNICFG